MAKPSGFSNGFGPGFGAGRYRYAMAPYVWDAAAVEGAGAWRLPGSAVGGVDLRPASARTAAGGTPQGFAFVAAMQPVSGVELVASLNMVDEDATAGIRDAWQGATGYRPAGAKLVDLLWDQLTVGADPTGDAGPKPLMPDHTGTLRLFVGGHSQVRAEPFRWGVHPHTDKVRAVHRDDFGRRWDQTDGDDHNLKVLGYLCNVYGIWDRWQELVPARLRASVRGPVAPATPQTDNFNRTENPLTGWTGVVSSHQANGTKAIGNAEPSFSRYSTALSGANHYAQVDRTDHHAVGPTCRKDSSGTLTFYLLWGNSDTALAIYKSESGAFTQIGPDITHTPASPNTRRLEVSGSGLEVKFNGSSVRTDTDTAISGGTYAGIRTFSNFNGFVDNYEADVLGGGGTPARPPGLMLLGCGE